MSHKNNGFSLAALLDIGALTTVMTALIYTAGWSYAYHYFSRFHLGLLDLEIEREYFFLYGFWALKEQWCVVFFWLLVTVVLTVLLGFLARTAPDGGEGGSAAELYAGATRRDISAGWGQPVAWVVASSYLLVLFVVFYRLGTDTGYAHFERQSAGDFPAYPRVKVWIAKNEKIEGETKAEKALAEQRRRDWAGGCYRLLLSNKEHVYLFYADGAETKIPVEIIAKKKVPSLRVLPLYQSSEECR